MSQSSQFASSLLLAAPTWKDGLELSLTGELSSLPYIDMTIDMMRRCGIDVKRNDRTIIVKSGIYKIDNITIEPDWSAAAFWYEMAALSDSANIFLKNLNINSLQADAVVMKIFDDLGVLEIIKDLKGEHPIILLDDVMSELDSTRQNYILNKMTGKQVFITCCEKETISRLCAGKVIKIEKGKAVD